MANLINQNGDDLTMPNTFNMTLSNNGADLIFVSVNGGNFGEYNPMGAPVPNNAVHPLPVPLNGGHQNLINLRFAGDEDGMPFLGSLVVAADFSQNGGQVIDENYTLTINSDLQIT